MPRRHLANIGVLGRSARPFDFDEYHPRPQLRRRGFTLLDGEWDFALDPDGKHGSPESVEWDRKIRVPFAPETERSGVNDRGLYKACWYRRSFERVPLSPNERLLLHFGAVDYEATVWVDGTIAGSHVGGYTPFEIDVTPHLDEARLFHEVIVRAEDDPGDLAKPRGKQDWKLEPHSIWYPRTSGIWQTVWLERVPETRLARLLWTANLERWEIGLHAFVVGNRANGATLRVELTAEDVLLARDAYAVVAGEVQRRIALSDPGIDDFRNELLWSPAVPRLLSARVEVLAEDGSVIDDVASYTALRTIAPDADRIVLNGRPYPLRFVLDQGYWPETGMTPPDDLALRRDVELAKAMGFNGVRKHQKLEVPRYLYWADRLGLLVWEEMPSAYRFTARTVARLSAEWLEALMRDASHPCVIAWVPFNESWGVPNLPNSLPERHYVQALYHLTKTVDPTRPVIGNDGWESVATDIIGIHDYDEPKRLGLRYRAREVLPALLARERPGGRALVLERAPADSPIVLSEFGGIAFAENPAGTWGYSRARTREELARKYKEFLSAVGALEHLCGFCYTQFADTYQEANGLLFADRTPKIPLAEIAAATRGATSRDEMPLTLGITERDGAPP
ncbi:MAG TPA: glycoside hydrolase family 2 TIM barrel-domain containing protein [Polyangiaceae bacterium]|nr:glycoside hydrolase family 2 TIM barrel-domain containing protein [Polyangiaceae bacterium]